MRCGSHPRERRGPTGVEHEGADLRLLRDRRALSTAFTLEPGDVIATGTPGGVGIALRPPRVLAPGDVVRVEIEGLGHLENRVVEEPAETATG
jgi:hypothetical protein